MNKTYRVTVCYSGAVFFDIEASNGEEAAKRATEDFDQMDDRELVANLDDICIDGVWELED